MRTNSNSDNLILDFQETSEIDSVFIVDNPRSGFGISTLTFDLNATANFATPAYSDSLTFSPKFGNGWKEFTQKDYRFMRINMTSSLGFCELSKLFVGKKIELLNNKSINFGWTYQDKEISTKKENRYGQIFTDVISRQKQFNIAFSNLNKDQLDQIFEFYDTKGTTKPFFVRIGCADMANNLERYAGMVYMTAIPVITNTRFNKYSLSMTLEEAM